MFSKKTWDQRYANLLERIMAAGVAGMDPKPLQEELRKLLAQRPVETTDAKG